MRPLLVIPLVVLVILPGATVALTQDQKEFLTGVMETKLALIATGEMAAEKVEKDSVRSFGQQVAEHHGELNNTAMALSLSVGTQPAGRSHSYKEWAATDNGPVGTFAKA